MLEGYALYDLFHSALPYSPTTQGIPYAQGYIFKRVLGRNITFYNSVSDSLVVSGLKGQDEVRRSRRSYLPIKDDPVLKSVSL